MEWSRKEGREIIQTSYIKNSGEFDDHVERNFGISSYDLLSWLVMAALGSHSGKSMSQRVLVCTKIAQRGFFGSACGKKYCEVSILQSDKSFVARRAR